MSKLFEYSDYDLQTAVDSNNNVTLQIVGIRDDGAKDVLKEFDKEVSFVGFNPHNPRQQVVAAPQGEKKDRSGLKIGSAFVLGLIVGGLVVFLIMKSRQEAIASVSAPPTGLPPPTPQIEPIMVEPENSMSQWMRDYDNDMFTR